MAITSHNTPALPKQTRGVLPAERWAELHDMLTLALDATENPSGYPQPLREARSYLRTALRRTRQLMGVQA